MCINIVTCTRIVQYIHTENPEIMFTAATPSTLLTSMIEVVYTLFILHPLSKNHIPPPKKKLERSKRKTNNLCTVIGERQMNMSFFFHLFAKGGGREDNRIWGGRTSIIIFMFGNFRF